MKVLAAALAAGLACATAHAQAPAAPAPTKACETARKKIDREQKSIAGAAESIARDRKARETCTSRVLCSRLDASIDSTMRRQARHEARLVRFEKEVADKCGG
ncbi:MAG: hypothetical protein U1F10_13715 [Burkholderiales bacterium]